MQSPISYVTTATGVRAEYLSRESRGTFTHSLELKHQPDGATKHILPILRRGASGRASGACADLDGILLQIELASPALLDEKPLVQRPEILVELIRRYEGLSGHAKLRAIEIARKLPDAIKQARSSKRTAGRAA